MPRYWNATAGDDRVTGSNNTENVFDDFGMGADRLTGGKKNDTFYMVNDEKTDRIDGGRGTDTVDYSQAFGGLRIDLDEGKTFGASMNDMGKKGILPEYLLTRMTSIENVVGTAYGDTIIGNDEDNVLTGGGGGDTFVFRDDMGRDVVTDFDGTGAVNFREFNEDQIVLDGVFEDRAELLAHTRVVGNDYVIEIDDHNSITLKNAAHTVGFDDIVLV